MLTHSAKCLQLDVRAFRWVLKPASGSAWYGPEACMIHYLSQPQMCTADQNLPGHAQDSDSVTVPPWQQISDHSICASHDLRWYCLMV